MRLLHIGAALFAALSPGCAATALPGPANDGMTARFERFTYSGKSQERVTLRAGEFRNPILSGYYPDPSITRVGADYYLVNSSFAHFPGLPIFHSKDLVNWTQIGNALDRPEQIDFTGRRVSEAIFAPDISFHDGLFYIVTTCVGCGGNFVMTASNPAGAWSKPVWFPFDGIDPSLFWDTDGKAYLVNNGPPIGNPLYSGHRAIWVQAFDYRKLRLIGGRSLIVNGGVDITREPSWIEGPHLFRKRDYYYLTAAEGGTGDNHSQVIFRSRRVGGPFVPAAHNPILTQRALDPNRPDPVTSAGHAKFVETQNGEWWATFLATRPYGRGMYNIGRETFLLPVTWKDDWPSILPSGERIPFALRKPDLPSQPRATHRTSGDFAYVDEFNGHKLALAWIGIRSPKAPLYHLERGALVLRSGQPLGNLDGVPGFIGRRQQHHVAVVSTTFDYDPAHDGDRAGLAAVQNDDSYLFFGVARVDGRRSIALFTRQNAREERLIGSAPIGKGEVTLSLRFDGGTLSADYARGGKARSLASGVDITFLSTSRAQGFVGTVIGPYVQSGDGSQSIM